MLNSNVNLLHVQIGFNSFFCFFFRLKVIGRHITRQNPGVQLNIWQYIRTNVMAYGVNTILSGIPGMSGN